MKKIILAFFFAISIFGKITAQNNYLLLPNVKEKMIFIYHCSNNLDTLLLKKKMPVPLELDEPSFYVNRFSIGDSFTTKVTIVSKKQIRSNNPLFLMPSTYTTYKITGYMIDKEKLKLIPFTIHPEYPEDNMGKSVFFFSCVHSLLCMCLLVLIFKLQCGFSTNKSKILAVISTLPLMILIIFTHYWLTESKIKYYDYLGVVISKIIPAIIGIIAGLVLFSSPKSVKK